MILVDTHVWLWQTVAPERLSPSARKAIDEADAVLVSVASCLEVAALERKGRIALDRDVTAWIRQAIDSTGVDRVEVDVEIATRAGTLPDPFPGDPADRLIYASAVARGVPLVTKDQAIRAFDPARTVW